MANVSTEKKKFSLKEYFRGIRIELKKVVWPTKSELISYTFIVIFTCTVMALILGAVDLAGIQAINQLR